MEMLVVVLIIGILASIAIPSYITAVDKARFVKMMDAVDTLAEAEEAYYLQYRKYAVSIQDLDVKLNYLLGTVKDTVDRDKNEYQTVSSYKFPGGGYVDISHAENYAWKKDADDNFILDEQGNKILEYKQERYVWATGHPKGVSYLRFLNHRAKRPGTRWCQVPEKYKDNERMNKLCRSMGGCQIQIVVIRQGTGICSLKSNPFHYKPPATKRGVVYKTIRVNKNPALAYAWAGFFYFKLNYFFLATFLAGFLVTFLVTFFAGFFATFLAQAFLQAFFAGFFATFLVTFLVAFLATFFTVFFTAIFNLLRQLVLTS